MTLFLLVALPWHLYEWAKFGTAFWRSYVGEEIVLRTKENLFWTVTLTHSDYLHFVSRFAHPWLLPFYFAGAGVILFWKWIGQKNRGVVLVSLITIASMVAVFFESKTK